MNKLQISWIVSTLALFGSLYFSEVKNFIPCSLCWYQRILMYPLVLILGVGLFKNDKNVFYYAFPLSVAGFFVSSFHYLKQKVNVVNEFAPCTTGVPCSGEYINWFGFVTIPFLAGTAFLTISILLFLFHKKTKNAN